MGNPSRFALLQEDAVGPTAEQLKRAFQGFNHLTDADAVRLARGARGILSRQLGRHPARALQRALQAQGVRVVILPESELPHLPEPLSLHRVEVWPQAFRVYDLRGRPAAIDWDDIAMVAAGAAQHFDISKAELEGSCWRKAARVPGRKIEPETQLLLEILVARRAARYQIDGTKFPFNYVIDRPGLTVEEKFIWLVREICRYAARATLNAGAGSLVQAAEAVPHYINPQALADEMTWLLWRDRQMPRNPRAA